MYVHLQYFILNTVNNARISYSLTDKFLQINKKENLEILNNQFLQHHADTVFISHQEFKQFLQKLKQNPMLQARQNEHLEQLPSHVRYIRQLCD